MFLNVFGKFLFKYSQYLTVEPKNKLPFNHKKMQEASLRKKCMIFTESGFEEITRYANFVCSGFMILDSRFSCYDIVPNRWGTSFFRCQTHLTPSSSIPKQTHGSLFHTIISTFQMKECACADCVGRLCTSFEIC